MGLGVSDSFYAVSGIVSLALGLSHLRFANREAAGDLLAGLLRSKIKQRNIVVLGVPRGGAVVAKKVSDRLGAELGLLPGKKVLAPESEEDAIGAIIYRELEYIDSSIVHKLNLQVDEIAESIERTNNELAYRQELYFGGNSPQLNVAGKTAIIIDDGAATGATLVACARYIKSLNPDRLLIAVPVASRNALEHLKSESVETVTIIAPNNAFRAVGQFYKNFAPVTHDDVIEIAQTIGKL